MRAEADIWLYEHRSRQTVEDLAAGMERGLRGLQLEVSEKD